MNYEAERRRLNAEYEAKLKEISMAETREKEAALQEVIDNDPVRKVARAHAEAIYKSEVLAAQRMVALVELADAHLKKNPVSPDDPRMVKAMFSMRQTNGMIGAMS